jgi:hypothetical protein
VGDKLLRRRLARRGLDLSISRFAGNLGLASAPVSAKLASTVVHAAVATGGLTSAGICPHIVSLMKSELFAMLLTKLTISAAVVVDVSAASVLAIGAVRYATSDSSVWTDEPKETLLVAARAGDESPKPKASDVAAAKRSQDNLHKIALAMHEYHERKGHLPTAAIYGADRGMPLLSWRVPLLPYLGEKDLYQQFNLNEAWDSAHNKPLLAKMPRIYASPRSAAHSETTFYQVFAGKGSVFDGATPISLREVTDGTSSTLMVAEAWTPVQWTKPQDLPFDPKGRIAPLGGIFKDGFYFVAVDGAVHYAKKGFDEKKLRAVIMRASGELKDFDLEP